MTALQDRFAALVEEHGPDVTLSVGDLLSLAAELQLAAILLRDLAEAMPMSLRMSMPQDLANRLYAGHYQDVLNECLPAERVDRIRGARRQLGLHHPPPGPVRARLHRARVRRRGRRATASRPRHRQDGRELRVHRLARRGRP